MYFQSTFPVGEDFHLCSYSNTLVDQGAPSAIRTDNTIVENPNSSSVNDNLGPIKLGLIARTSISAGGYHRMDKEVKEDPKGVAVVFGGFHRKKIGTDGTGIFNKTKLSFLRRLQVEAVSFVSFVSFQTNEVRQSPQKDYAFPMLLCHYCLGLFSSSRLCWTYHSRSI